MKEAEEPKAIKIKEKPKVKKTVFAIIKFFFFFFELIEGRSRNVRNIPRY